MDQHHVSIWTRSLRGVPSRRDVVRALAGAGLGLGALRLSDVASAKNKKKGKKVTLCHKGQTITVAKSAVKGHKRHGDTAGRCSSGPAGPTPAGPALTYQCPGPKNSGVTGNGEIRFAQTFTAERSGSLRQIQFSVNKKPGTAGDYVVQLLRVSGGKPSHSPIDVLASVTVPDAQVATSSDAIVPATFSGPTLVAGTEYAAALSRPGVGLGEVTVNTLKVGGGACGGKLFLAVQGDVFAEEILAQDALVSVRVN
jgi:hypothetical protein